MRGSGAIDYTMDTILSINTCDYTDFDFYIRNADYAVADLDL